MDLSLVSAGGGHGVLFRFDPRLKLITLILLTLSLFKVPLPALGAGLIAAAGVLLTCGPPLRQALGLLFSALRFVLFVTIMIMLLHFSVKAPFDGIIAALPMLFRLHILILLGFLFTATTTTPELRGTFYFFTRIIPGFPSATFAVMVSVTLSTIPRFFANLTRSREALHCRGGIPWYRPLRHMKALGMPLLTRLFRQSDILTDSLLSRGFDSDKSFDLPQPPFIQVLGTIGACISLLCCSIML